MPLRTQQQESCLSDRAHHPGARTQAYTPMTPTYTRDTRDRSAPGFHETCNEQMFSGKSLYCEKEAVIVV